MRRLNKRGKIALLIFGLLLATTGIVFFAHSGIDLSSKQMRDNAANQDAQSALNFALMGEYDPNNINSIKRVVGEETFDNFQSDLKKEIKKTFVNNAAIADSVEFEDKKYNRDEVLDQLVDRYLATVWADKNYSIDEINYDRYGNITVNYRVEPIDINQVQQNIQLEVNFLISGYYPEGEDRPTQPKMTLIELILMVEQWDTIVKSNNILKADAVTGSFNMNFHRNFRDPYFSIERSQLTELLNSGIITSQRGN